jgi:hypothetical protein
MANFLFIIAKVNEKEIQNAIMLQLGERERG